MHVGDATYDDWVVVRDFDDLRTALAFRDQLRDAGIKAVLTSDWELDRFRRGDIALRVEGVDYGDCGRDRSRGIGNRPKMRMAVLVPACGD